MKFFSKLFKRHAQSTPKTDKNEVIFAPDGPGTAKEPTIPALGLPTTMPQIIDIEVEGIGKLSHLDFGKPCGELGCYLNYTPWTLYPPSDRQLKLLNELGVYIPDGITNVDASCMISRAIGEDSKESPRPATRALADGFNIEYSAFVGDVGLFNATIRGVSTRDRAALYAYGVRQNLRGSLFLNMLEDSELARFYEFADHIAGSPNLLRSLADREPEDFKKPYRGTAIYKATVAFLESK